MIPMVSDTILQHITQISNFRRGRVSEFSLNVLIKILLYSIFSYYSWTVQFNSLPPENYIFMSFLTRMPKTLGISVFTSDILVHVRM